jgi:Xaa-Pro aminopeptidase
LTPGTSERAAGAAVRAACERHDVAADVVLVGGEGRVRNYRHFTPTGDTLGRYALVSVTGTWKGLHASLTRTVAFDPPAWLEERHRDCAAVEAAALAATRRVGCDSGTAGEVFAAITDAYEAAEVPDEWREHHQGGAAGYAGREWFVGPDCDAAVELPMAFAYNPTIQGAKSEDTVLVTDEGVEVLTRTGEWPTVTVEADGGETLERHGVLTVDDGTDQG